MSSYPPKGWFLQEYVSNKRTIRDIASELGVARKTVSRRLIKLGIPLRRVGRPSESVFTGIGRTCAECGSEFRTNAKKRIYCAQCQQLRRHNLTKAQLERLIELDGVFCALCGKPQPKYKTVEVLLAMDHDHRCCPGKYSCGKCVRGRLCSNCNRLVGQIEAAGFTLEQLTTYLGRRPFFNG